MSSPSPLAERLQALNAQIRARAAGDQPMLDLLTERDRALVELLTPQSTQQPKKPDGQQ